MRNDRVGAKVLSAKIIPNVDKQILNAYKIDKNFESLAIFTTDSDDVGYVALDEATKKANIEVVYAKSMYAGAKNASTKYAGEFIGIIAGDNPDDVRCGLDAAINYVENVASFFSANDDNSVIYFNHCISSVGDYLSKIACVKKGTSMAYLIAPPLEAMVGLDFALKVANVKVKQIFAPPSHTNFSGALLVGEQYECEACCQEFKRAIECICDNPLAY